MLTMALRYETATRSALGSFCQLLFAAILEFVVFGAVPSPLSATGAVIIIAAQVYAIVRPYLCRVPLNSHSFVCFRFSSQSRICPTNLWGRQVQYIRTTSKRDYLVQTGWIPHRMQSCAPEIWIPERNARRGDMRVERLNFLGTCSLLISEVVTCRDRLTSKFTHLSVYIQRQRVLFRVAILGGRLEASVLQGGTATHLQRMSDLLVETVTGDLFFRNLLSPGSAYIV